MPAELDAWLDLAKEDAIEPDLPICDPHHHLWDHTGDRYMIDEVTADFAGGHNIVQSVFVEVNSMYRASGPVEMHPVGETEVCAGHRRSERQRPLRPYQGGRWHRGLRRPNPRGGSGAGVGGTRLSQ